MADNKQRSDLVKDGVSEYTIVRGECASPSEITAAQELQKYIKAISGAEVPIILDSAPATEKEIVVGKTNREAVGDFNREEFKEEGFVIKTTGSKLWIVGAEKRGTLYGVYTFLEEYLGCRFYMRDIEKIPQKRSISFEAIKEDKQIPLFQFRDAACYDYRFADFAVKRKINFNTWHRYLSEELGGGISYAKGRGGHTFSFFLNAKDYFETHPEYFSMNENGERVPDKQLCLTNPEVLEIVKKGVRQWLDEDPSAQIITISQNDILGPCLCDNCKKVYEEEGGAFAGTLIRFVNTIAEDIAEDYPNVWVDTYAYQYSRSIPTKTKPRDNVMVRLCTIECDFSKPHSEDMTVSKNASHLNGESKTFAEDLKEWGQICKNVFMYDYNANFQQWALPFPDYHNIRKNFEYYANNNTLGVMTEGNCACLSPELSALRGYLLSKLLWKPYMDLNEFDSHMSDFLEGVYGPGGKFIREYIQLAEDVTKNVFIGLSTETDDMFPVSKDKNHEEDELPEDLTVEKIRNYQSTDWVRYRDWYTVVKENPITSKGEELFKKAMELAENSVQKEQLNRIYTQIEYMKSYYYKKKMDVEQADLRKLIQKYMEVYSAEFSDSERSDLPDRIVQYISKQDCSVYVQYNKELCEKFISRGITQLYGGLPFDEFLPKFDYSKVPVDWFERYWLNV